jgi:hypothetical protein
LKQANSFASVQTLSFGYKGQLQPIRVAARAPVKGVLIQIRPLGIDARVFASNVDDNELGKNVKRALSAAGNHFPRCVRDGLRVSSSKLETREIKMIVVISFRRVSSHDKR